MSKPSAVLGPFRISSAPLLDKRSVILGSGDKCKAQKRANTKNEPRKETKGGQPLSLVALFTRALAGLCAVRTRLGNIPQPAVVRRVPGRCDGGGGAVRVGWAGGGGVEIIASSNARVGLEFFDVGVVVRDRGGSRAGFHPCRKVCPRGVS